MLNWIIIVILVIVGLSAIKMSHLRHRVFIISLVLLALFLYASIFFISSKNDLDLDSTEGVTDALKVYVGWLANGFQNFKTITGNMIKMDWSSTNGTFLNKTLVDK